MKKDAVYFADDCWNYVKKEVDLNNYKIIYKNITGFQNKEEAIEALRESDKEYNEMIKKVKNLTEINFTFTEYLIYWYENNLKIYAENNYISVCHWTIFSLIIPSVDHDILLSMVSAAYINKLLKQIVPVCKSAAPQARKILSIMFKDASSNGLCRNPMDGVDRYSFDIPKTVYYTQSNIKKFLAEARNYASGNMYLEILLGIFSGLRSGEVLGLKWSDIDFDEKSVSIRRQITRDYCILTKNGKTERHTTNTSSIKPPKSANSYRTIRLPDVTMAELRKRKAYNDGRFNKHPEYSREWIDYVCIGDKGTLKNASTLLNALLQITRRACIPHLSFHDLRHIACCIMFENGVPLSTVSKVLGHSSEQTTYNVYLGIISARDEIREFIEGSMDPRMSFVDRRCEYVI